MEPCSPRSVETAQENRPSCERSEGSLSQLEGQSCSTAVRARQQPVDDWSPRSSTARCCAAPPSPPTSKPACGSAKLNGTNERNKPKRGSTGLGSPVSPATTCTIC